MAHFKPRRLQVDRQQYIVELAHIYLIDGAQNPFWIMASEAERIDASVIIEALSPHIKPPAEIALKTKTAGAG